MKNLSPQAWSRVRLALAVGAGLLWSAAFPLPGLAGFGWLAPGLLLAVSLGANGRGAFRLGYVAGLAHYLASLSWLRLMPYPPGAIAAWLALSAFLALYPAAWLWCCWEFFPAPKLSGDAGLAAATDRLLAPEWFRRTGWALLCAATWVAWEMVQARLLSGFPWNFLGVSQYRLTPLLQIAAYTGVYGISFLMVWSSVALLLAFVLVCRRPASRWAWRGEIVLPLLVVAAIIAAGFESMILTPVPARELKVALVQPSIPQTLIWDERENTNRFAKLLQLSEVALAARPDLLIWPEAALPSISPENFSALTNLIAARRAWMIFGADDVEPRVPGAPPVYYNASFLFDRSGRYVASYRKRHLVIFGEYVPLVDWLPFLKYVTPIGSGFASGERPVPFQLDEPRVKASSLICFEDAFPQLVREYVDDDTDFLVNLTNNGWFGESAAQWQHAANAVFRAVENGLPLVRCANNGLTCWVDAHGRMHETFFGDTTDIYVAGFKTARIPLLPEGQKRTPTFYTQHGDWFGWSCVAWVAVRLARRQWSRRRVGASSKK